MGKRKLQQFAEIATFDNVFEFYFSHENRLDFDLKGKWSKNHFKNDNPITLELGCGKGEYSVSLAQQFPNRNFVGVDIKGSRIWRGSKTALEENINNVVFVRTLIEQIDSVFGKEEVDELWITFPDPQLKDKREKKRLTSSAFLQRYGNILKQGAIVNLKTDNLPLFEYSKEVVESEGHQILVSSADLYHDLENDGILNIRTHYEQLFLKQGFKICYLRFRYIHK